MPRYVGAMVEVRESSAAAEAVGWVRFTERSTGEVPTTRPAAEVPPAMATAAETAAAASPHRRAHEREREDDGQTNARARGRSADDLRAHGWIIRSNRRAVSRRHACRPVERRRALGGMAPPRRSGVGRRGPAPPGSGSASRLGGNGRQLDRARRYGPSSDAVGDSAPCREFGTHVLERLARIARTTVPTRVLATVSSLSRWGSVRHEACGVQGLMNALRALSDVIARWRLRRIAKRRLREMFRRDSRSHA